MASPSPSGDYPPVYESSIRGLLVECFTPQDALTIDFADRVLAGDATANAPQSLSVVGVLRSYGCYEAASEMLELAIAGKMDPDPGGGGVVGVRHPAEE